MAFSKEVYLMKHTSSINGVSGSHLILGIVPFRTKVLFSEEVRGMKSGT
jgi:hypothetical protein